MVKYNEISFNINNYSCTNLTSLPQLPPRRFTMCSSLSFQRCLITRGIIKIALAQAFANVADIEDHAFNQLEPQEGREDHRGAFWLDTLDSWTALVSVVSATKMKSMQNTKYRDARAQLVLLKTHSHAQSSVATSRG